MIDRFQREIWLEWRWKSGKEVATRSTASAKGPTWLHDSISWRDGDREESAQSSALVNISDMAYLTEQSASDSEQLGYPWNRLRSWARVEASWNTRNEVGGAMWRTCMSEVRRCSEVVYGVESLDLGHISGQRVTGHLREGGVVGAVLKRRRYR